jgi:hypothetical protein
MRTRSDDLVAMALQDPTVREWIRGGDYRSFADAACRRA